jgi:hypothetical protein
MQVESSTPKLRVRAALRRMLEAQKRAIRTSASGVYVNLAAIVDPALMLEEILATSSKIVTLSGNTGAVGTEIQVLLDSGYQVRLEVMEP